MEENEILLSEKQEKILEELVSCIKVGCIE